jgi:hypothetical protein
VQLHDSCPCRRHFGNACLVATLGQVHVPLGVTIGMIEMDRSERNGRTSQMKTGGFNLPWTTRALWITLNYHSKKRLNNPTMIEPPRNCQISGSHSEECFGSWCKHIASSLVLVSTALHLRWKPRRFILVIGRHHPEWPRGSLLLLGATSLDCCKATALSLTPAAIFCTAHKV